MQANTMESGGSSQLSENSSRAHWQHTRPSQLQHTTTPTTPAYPVPESRLSSKRHSLSGIFGRSKSTRATASAPHLYTVSESQSPTALNHKRSVDQIEQSARVPKSTASLTNSLLSPTSAQNSSPRPGPSRSPKSPRCLTSWDPPPLFQAEPQAIKHSNLPASTLESDFILKARKRTTGNVNGRRDNAKGDNNHQQEDKVRRHKRTISGSLSRAQWVRKIYVLVTSGYLLQYAGDGPFNRLPEKMMRLGKDSVVFVSDAIPGKPWVLQISQTSEADGGVVVEPTRSFFSRLRLRNADTRRATSSFLLVFDDPEEMEAWLGIIRREIEAFGGKIRPDSPSQQSTPRPPPENQAQSYLVTPEQNAVARQNLGETPSDRSNVLSFTLSERSISDGGLSTDTRPMTAALNRASWAPTEAPSLSTTITSVDLDDSRARRRSATSGTSIRRHSIYSSSPSASPTRGQFGLVLPDLPPFDYPEAPYKLPSTQIASQTSQSYAIEGNERPRAISQPERGESPVTPNFSLPRSSHRFPPSGASTFGKPNPPLSILVSEHQSASRMSGRDSMDGESRSRPLSTISDLPSPSTIIAPPLSTRLKAPNNGSSPISPLFLDNGEVTNQDENASPDEGDTPTLEHFPDTAPLPKRISSLAYAQQNTEAMAVLQSNSLRPRPIEPERDHDYLKAEYTDMSGLRSPTSSTANTGAKRRPLSLQPVSPKRSSLAAATSTHKALAHKRQSHQPRTLGETSRSPPRLSHSQSLSGRSSTILPRKSMTDFRTLGPPAPPPDCPLPALPPPQQRPQSLSPNAALTTRVLRPRQSLNIPPSRGPPSPKKSQGIGLGIRGASVLRERLSMNL